MSDYLDISVPLSVQLPVWPGGYGYNKYQLMSIKDGAGANVSRVDFDVHSGTHIDAPLHFVEEGKTTLEIPVDVLIGNCFVVVRTGLNVITASDIVDLQIPFNVDKILFKTNNSDNKWFRKPFDVDFVAISNDAAELLVKRNIRVVGIDGPSIQKYQDSSATHITLLQNDVVILEGLNLDGIEEGVYKLICLPVKAEGCEGISARAILQRI